MRLAPLLILVLLGAMLRLIWDAIGDPAEALDYDKPYQ